MVPILPYNNRTTTNTGVIGNAYGNLYANIVEPIVRGVRHTRKTNAIGNLRESGNVAVNYKGQPLINRSDAPNVTNREMDSTKLDFNHLNVQRQTDGAQASNHYQPVENQRATTNYTDFGNIGANQCPGGDNWGFNARTGFNYIHGEHVGFCIPRVAWTEEQYLASDPAQWVYDLREFARFRDYPIHPAFR